MKMVTSPAEMQQTSLALRRGGRRIGFVPTMGYLHEGHLSLIREARRRADVVVVSIYVNPTQFAPEEDFARYPRDLERDCTLCESEKTDYLFAPDDAAMYPKDFSTYVTEERIARRLEGASRPLHFRGVCTVVAKLFNIVLPDVAIFGQKDAQQALIVKRLVRDLNFPVEIVVAPTARDADGLALSSRNAYLSASERKQAQALWAALDWAQQAFRKGVRETSELRKGMCKIILYAPSAKIDYIEFVNAETFEPVLTANKGTLIVMAVWIGKTRLIDNHVLA